MGYLEAVTNFMQTYTYVKGTADVIESLER